MKAAVLLALMLPAGALAAGNWPQYRGPAADIGLLTCFDARTGEIRYSERVNPRSEGYTASPVSDGRHLYVTSELGNVHVIPATASFSIVATNALGETCLSTPALSRGTLYFRTREKLVAVGGP